MFFQTRRSNLILSSALGLAILGGMAVVAMPSDVVRLPGGESISGTRSYRLRGIDWNTRTNRVSAVLEMRVTDQVSKVVAPRFEIGTYDHTSLPLTIKRHLLDLKPTLDASGTRLIWTISDFQMPEGEKFAGVFVSRGSYQRGYGTDAETRSILITLAIAHNQW